MQLFLVKQRETQDQQTQTFQVMLEASVAKLEANAEYSNTGHPKKRHKLNSRKYSHYY